MIIMKSLSCNKTEHNTFKLPKYKCITTTWLWHNRTHMDRRGYESDESEEPRTQAQLLLINISPGKFSLDFSNPGPLALFIKLYDLDITRIV